MVIRSGDQSVVYRLHVIIVIEVSIVGRAGRTGCYVS